MIGRVLNHYRILRSLGAGGMGEVYEAEDTKLGRRVALKVLPAEMARDPRRRERFEREAQSIAALNHPHIVTIYSVEQADGVDFITMELVDGKTLTEAIPRGGLGIKRLLDLAIPLAEAVAAAHQQGITHRDLKPDNIVIGRDGRLKVLDFGLAKTQEGEAAQMPGSTRLPTRSVTGEGRIVGTVAYMSPEQAEGMPVDPRSDVFSLGIILYEMSTGARPFQGESAVSIMSAILRDTPPPVTRLNHDLPRDLARIIERCLAKDPARRFQSAQGLASELATLKHDSDSGELKAMRGGLWQGSTPGRPLTIGYAAAALVVVVAILGYVALRMARDGSGPGASLGDGAGHVEGAPGAPGGAAGDRRRIVVLPFENLGAPQDAYFAAGVTEEITSRLASVGGLGVISRTSAVQYAKSGKTTREIGRELGVAYVLEGTVRWDRPSGKTGRVRVSPQLIRVADDTHLWADRYDRDMQDIFSVQSDIAEQVVEKLGVAVGASERRALGARPTGNIQAYQTYLRGKEQLDLCSSGREHAEAAVKILKQAIDLDPGFAPAWAALSKAHSAMYQFGFDFTEERLSQARECADKALTLQSDLREGHIALGYYYYWGRHDYEQALKEFETAAAGRGDDSAILEATAYIKRRQGHWDEALATMLKAFELNPRNSSLAGQIGGTYQYLRRYPEALRYLDLAISLSHDPGDLFSKATLQLEADGNTRAARGTLRSIDHAAFPQCAWFEAHLDFLDGDFETAGRRLRAIPEDHFETQTAYFPKSLILGMMAGAANDMKEARSQCELARQAIEREIKNRPRDPRLRAALGTALACVGRNEEAVREARLAADMTPISSDAVIGPEYVTALAQVETLVGDHDAALTHLEQVLAIPAGGGIRMIELNPIWAPLRQEPRYKKLVEKYR